MKHTISGIDIYWFSGSGNSLIIALEVKDYFTKQGYKTHLFPLEKIDPTVVNTDSTIGFVIPVAGQSTYPFIWEFIEALPETENTPCFLIDTLAVYSGGILGPVKRILKKKGYTPLAAKEIRMPNNFQKKKSDPHKDHILIENGKRSAREFCGKLIQGKGWWVDIPGYSRLLSIFYRYRKFVSMTKNLFPLTIDTKKCNGCGICITLCPEKCLRLNEQNYASIHTSACSLCHRCFSFCPKGAIHIGSDKAIPYKALPLKTLLSQLHIHKRKES